MAKLTKEIMQQNLDAIAAQAGQVQASAMFEAGKAVGRTEGQQDILRQIVALMDKDEEAELTPATLKLAEEAAAEPAPE